MGKLSNKLNRLDILKNLSDNIFLINVKEIYYFDRFFLYKNAKCNVVTSLNL